MAHTKAAGGIISWQGKKNISGNQPTICAHSSRGHHHYFAWSAVGFNEIIDFPFSPSFAPIFLPFPMFGPGCCSIFSSLAHYSLFLLCQTLPPSFIGHFLLSPLPRGHRPPVNSRDKTKNREEKRRKNGQFQFII